MNDKNEAPIRKGCVLFIRRTRIEAPAEEVFRWHARPGALERLSPPWEQVEVIERTGGLEDGARVSLQVRIGPVRQRWISEHRDYQEGRQFRDVQIRGPFAWWDHTHLMESDGPYTCSLEDRIEYALPFGRVGRLLGGSFVRKKLERLFDYRHRITAQDIAVHRLLKGGSPMKVLVSGATGLIGSALVPFLTTGGHQVVPLARSKSGSGDNAVHWDPATGNIDAASLEGLDAVVHLAGESIAQRWTPASKARIRESRAKGTRLLAGTLAKLSQPPKVMVCASAIGYYGDRGEEVLKEESGPASDFLGQVCQEWESATEPAAQSGIRVVNLRIGIVLSPAGGALAQMLRPFKMGVGGVIGSGRQYWSWIAIDDLVSVILYALATETLQGPVNAVSPNPVTNHEFTKTLGRILGRPTLLPMPAFAARLVLGEMADALLLASARVEPARLSAAGYGFRYPELEGALRHVLGR